MGEANKRENSMTSFFFLSHSIRLFLVCYRHAYLILMGQTEKRWSSGENRQLSSDSGAAANLPREAQARFRPNKNIAFYFPLSVRNQLITTHTHTGEATFFSVMYTQIVFSIFPTVRLDVKICYNHLSACREISHL